MPTIDQVMRQVEEYRAKEMKKVDVLRQMLAPVWIDAYGSIQNRNADGMTFNAFIAATLDELPID